MMLFGGNAFQRAWGLCFMSNRLTHAILGPHKVWKDSEK